MWAIPRPAAPAAFPWTLQASPLPIYVALSTLRPRRKSVEMSDEDFIPVFLSVGCLIDRTRFVSMDEVSSEDEELQSRPRNLSSPTQA